MPTPSHPAPAQFDRRLAFSFGAVVLILVLTATGVATALFYRLQTREENRLTGAIAAILGESVSRVSFSGKHHTRLLAEEMQKRIPELSYISVETPEGIILAHSDPIQDDARVEGEALDMLHKTLQTREAVIRERDTPQGAVKEVVIPYRGGFNDLVAGAVRVGVRVQEARDSQKTNVVTLLVLVAGLTLGAIGAVFLLSRRFGGDVRTLATQLRGILDHTPLAIAISARNGRILTQSISFENAFGRSSRGDPLINPLRGQDTPEEARVAIREMDQQAFLQAEKIEREVEIESEGQLKQWHVTMFPVSRDPRGAVEQVCTFLRDVSGQKQAERRVLEILRRLTSIASTVPVILYEFEGPAGNTQENRFTYVSDKIRALAGIEPKDMMADARVFFRLIHPEDLEGTLSASDDAMRSLNPFRHEFRIIHPLGEVKWVLAESLPSGGDTSYSSWSGYFKDITEEKEAGQALEQAKEQAVAANRAKSEFLANMSHEIRTPLNGVMSMLQLLETTSLYDEQKEYVFAALKSSNRLTRLLADILDLSRIEAGKLVLNETEFEMIRQKESILELFGVAAKRKGLELDVQLDERIPPRLIGDKARLRQILFNLVGNAIKFTDKGQVLLNAFPLTSPSDNRLQVLFTVRDTGIGIPDDRLKDVFEPFVQVEGSYIRSNQGAGLGLSIVRKLVKLMNGELAIGTTDGGGTTIYLSLPFKTTKIDSRQAGLQVQTAGNLANTCLRVLLAEDDKMNLLGGKRLLEKAGYSVTVAQDGQEVLQHLTEQDFDLILMDIQMPLMDGVETTKYIRSSSVFKDKAKMPIIAMTAYAMIGDREKFIEAGIDDYIAKPIDMDELRQIIERVMAVKSETPQ